MRKIWKVRAEIDTDMSVAIETRRGRVEKKWWLTSPESFSVVDVVTDFEIRYGGRDCKVVSVELIADSIVDIQDSE